MQSNICYKNPGINFDVSSIMYNHYNSSHFLFQSYKALLNETHFKLGFM